MTAVVDNLGARTEYVYDFIGRRVSTKNPMGRTTRYEYDKAGRLTATITPMGRRTGVSYDPLGRPISRTNAAGERMTITYDDALRSVEYHSTSGWRSSTRFDAMGRPTSPSDPTGITSITYGATGGLSSRIDPSGRELRYLYDSAGRPIVESYDDLATRFSYDLRGRLETVTSPDGAITRYHYDSVNRPIRTDLPNGIIEERTFDNRNRTQSITTRNRDGDVVLFIEYEYDDVGRITHQNKNGRITSYSYDDVGRLSLEHSGTSAIHYQHDASGNVISKTDNGATSTYTYDHDDALLTEATFEGVTEFSYDEAGRRVRLLKPNGDSIRDSWDFEHLMSTDVDIGATTHNIEYSYGFRDMRTGIMVDGVTTQQVFGERGLNRNILATVEGGDITSWHTYGLRRISETLHGDVGYFHSDAIGTTHALSDEFGGITSTFDYWSYGQVRDRQGTSSTDFLYAGEQYNNITETIYLRSRDYDPRIGRFTSRDTFSGLPSVPMSQNPYLYGNADPINHTDPSGHFSLSETVQVLTIASIVAQVAVVGGVSAWFGELPRTFGVGAFVALEPLPQLHVSALLGLEMHLNPVEKSGSLDAFFGAELSYNPPILPDPNEIIDPDKPWTDLGHGPLHDVGMLVGWHWGDHPLDHSLFTLAGFALRTGHFFGVESSVPLPSERPFTFLAGVGLPSGGLGGFIVPIGRTFEISRGHMTEGQMLAAAAAAEASLGVPNPTG